MSRKPEPVVPKRPTLRIPRSDAEARIREQVEKGQELLGLQIESIAELDQARAEKQKWSDFNSELLRRIADTDDLVRDYQPSVGIAFLGGRSSFSASVKDYRSDVRRYVTRLESIHDRLELIPEAPDLARPTTTMPKRAYAGAGKRVFIVHGHDEEAKQSVARCLEKLDLEALILHEHPNEGRTIIEKFENYADVRFAVVLLTPDDVGAARNEPDNLRPRARQNVILELGFFLGRLKRHQVCALHKGDVEIPSDFAGVLWVPMDPGGAWRFTLARELKAAGLEVDLNRLA